ncbi:MAG: DUF4249 family protein [Candidatus Kapaibacterium sp.]|jgi:hypothetical protein
MKITTFNIAAISHSFLMICLAIVSVVFLSCEQVVDNTDLLYVEKIVVASYVTAGDTTISVDITKTLPLQQIYTREAAVIQDADVSITTPYGQKKLVYNPRTTRYETPVNIIRPGDQYSLVIEWRNKKVTASTRVPEIPSVLSTATQRNFNRLSYQYEYRSTIEFVNNPRACIGLIRSDWGSALRDTTDLRNLYDGSYYPDYVQTIYNPSSDRIVYQRKDYDYWADPSYDISYIMMLFAAYDAPFHALNLRGNESGNDGIFGSSGTNPQFTVKGDGIGFFIGVQVFPSIIVIPTKS